MTNTEYLLRTVRDSERMHGWQDTFSKMREELSRQMFKSVPEPEMDDFETEDAFER